MLKLVTSLLIMGSTASLVAGAGFALLSDNEASANTFATGTLDLQVKNQEVSEYGDGVAATWTLSNLKPGDQISGWLRLRNDGSIVPGYIGLSATNEVIDPPGPESDTEENTEDLDREMIITEMKYIAWSGDPTIDCLQLLDDIDGDSKISLDELEAQGIDNLPAPADKDRYYTLNMTLTFDVDANNDYQGDILTSTLAFISK